MSAVALIQRTEQAASSRHSVPLTTLAFLTLACLSLYVDGMSSGWSTCAMIGDRLA